MKTDYLKQLRSLLDNYVIEDVEKDEIINDYNDMYDNWIEYGMNEKDVEIKLGSPQSIISELTEGCKKVSKHIRDQKARKSGKIIAITPFIALIAFFILGFGFDGWAYSWAVFLIIPITAIISEMSISKAPHVITALSPFVAVIAYLILGFFYDLWHPGWLVFLIIPVIAILTEKKSIGFLNTLVALSPFAAVVTFIYLGELGYWQTGWLVFLIIPALGVLNNKSPLKIIVWELVIIGGAAGYLYIGYTYDTWGYALLAFLPLLAFGISQDDEGFKGMRKDYRIVSILVITTYIVFNIIFGWWIYSWLVFLIIPVYAIIKEVKGSERIIAITPFIALTIFFALGWIFSLWAYAWLAFLIIPVVAIIKEG